MKDMCDEGDGMVKISLPREKDGTRCHMMEMMLDEKEGSMVLEWTVKVVMVGVIGDLK